MLVGGGDKKAARGENANDAIRLILRSGRRPLLDGGAGLGTGKSEAAVVRLTASQAPARRASGSPRSHARCSRRRLIGHSQQQRVGFRNGFVLLDCSMRTSGAAA